MTKKVLIISSSPRRGGNTDTLCNEFMHGATEAGSEVEKVFLRDKTIHFCTGCGTCSIHGKSCPQKDDAAEVIQKMVVADVIVLATPIYFYAMSAQMKTLIDRCCGLYTQMNDKEFYFIAAGAEGEEGVEKLSHTFDNLMGFLDCLENPVLKGKILATGVWHAGEITGNPALTEAYEMGKNLINKKQH